MGGHTAKSYSCKCLILNFSKSLLCMLNWVYLCEKLKRNFLYFNHGYCLYLWETPQLKICLVPCNSRILLPYLKTMAIDVLSSANYKIFTKNKHVLNLISVLDPKWIMPCGSCETWCRRGCSGLMCGHRSLSWAVTQANLTTCRWKTTTESVAKIIHTLKTFELSRCWNLSSCIFDFMVYHHQMWFRFIEFTLKSTLTTILT